MAKCFSKSLVLFLTILMLLSAPIVVQATWSNNEGTFSTTLVSFEDGIFSNDEKGFVHSDDGCAIVDSVSYTSEGKSLEWTMNQNRIAFNLSDDKGFADLGGTVVLKIRLKGTGAGYSFNYSCFDTQGTSVCAASYEVSNDEWFVLSTDLNSSTFWNSSTSAYFALDCLSNGLETQGENILYVDSVWLEKAPFERQLVIHDFDKSAINSSETPNYGTSITGGAQAAPGSTNYLLQNYNTGTGADRGLFIYNYNRATLDWSGYKNLVFRMKAVNPGGTLTDTSHNFYFTFFCKNQAYNASGYTATRTEIIKNVAVDTWQDYKFPISDLQSVYTASDTGNTIGSIRVLHRESSSAIASKAVHLYIDSIFLEGYAETGLELAAPEININDSNVVNPDLTGDQTLRFTFAEQLLPLDYTQAVTATENGAPLASSNYTVTASGAEISVKFHDMLNYQSTYQVTLAPDMIYTQQGKVLSSEASTTFTVGYNKGFVSFDRAALVAGALQASFCLPPGEGNYAIHLSAFDANGRRVAYQTDYMSAGASSVSKRLSLTVPAMADNVKGYITNPVGTVIYSATLTDSGKESVVLPDSVGAITVLNFSASARNSFTLSGTTETASAPVLVTITNPEGVVLSEDVAVTETTVLPDTGGALRSTFTFDDATASDTYTVSALLGTSKKELDFLYVNNTDANTLLEKVNGHDKNALMLWMREHTKALGKGLQSNVAILDAASVLEEQASTYADYEAVRAVLDQLLVNFTGLNGCIWSNLAGFINTNHSFILPSGSATYSYFSGLSTKKQNEICVTIAGGIPFGSLADFRGSFDSAVTAYQVAQNEPDTDGDDGRGGSVGGGGGRGVTARLEVPPTKPVTQPEQIPTETTESVFTDMGEYSWAQESVEILYKQGVVSLATDNCYRPSDNVKREEFVKLLVEAFFKHVEAEQVLFTDASKTGWYNDTLSVARSLGIINGKDDGSFGIGESLTREDMVVMSCRALEAMGISFDDADAPVFTDSDMIATYAKPYVTAMTNNGVVNGMGDDTFGPKLSANRAQAAVLIVNLLNTYKGGSVQ